MGAVSLLVFRRGQGHLWRAVFVVVIITAVLALLALAALAVEMGQGPLPEVERLGPFRWWPIDGLA